MDNKIVIVQTYSDHLGTIQNGLSKRANGKIMYTTDPREAFLAASRPSCSMLITGQQFYASGKTNSEMMGLLLCDPAQFITHSTRAMYQYGSYNDGNSLAAAVRAENNSILTLRYSATPKRPDHFCGELDKGSLAIFSLLNDKNLINFLGNRKKSCAPQHEGLQWYLNSFPETWQ